MSRALKERVISAVERGYAPNRSELFRAALICYRAFLNRRLIPPIEASPGSSILGLSLTAWQYAYIQEAIDAGYARNRADFARAALVFYLNIIEGEDIYGVPKTKRNNQSAGTHCT